MAADFPELIEAMTMRPQHNLSPQHASATSGFTLIEIMIVVGLAGILAMIALSSYQANVRKTRRYAAESCLVEQAQYMERYYTSANNPMSYTGAVLPSATCKTNLASYYAFSLVSASQAFTVRAVASGTQTGDTNCRTLALNEAALQSSSSATVSTTGCWP
jgi:type IV pilus assembly protein PilE